MRIESDAFLVELNDMFQKSRMGGSDSVTITLKHYDGRIKPHPKDPKKAAKAAAKAENFCMFRARLGNKKISCVVPAKEVNKFQSAYSSVLKCNMDNLKKPEKVEKKKAKKPAAEKPAAPASGTASTTTSPKPAK
ncbi:hypothetical protein QR680_003958 [Steinernema hermaphroditum]|uniref:Signal recognition particle 14 kDa protein n=1 Tax=Steinernema hermaphroditum TaxID=289476 RepID=A0AA39LSZ7_9BILA|nr:hypothetical protein QR680_003958 [Steinernema hermaphroditum]